MVLYLNWHRFMHKVFRGLRENSLNCEVNPYCNNLPKKKKKLGKIQSWRVKMNCP